MPHIIIEYSKGLPKAVDPAKLVSSLHSVAAAHEALPTGGIRTRGYEADISKTADGAPDRHFIYVSVRIGQGRSESVKRDIGDKLFAALTEFTHGYLADGNALSLGLEIQEIEKDWTWKKNNIHQILKDEDNGSS